MRFDFNFRPKIPTRAGTRDDNSVCEDRYEISDGGTGDFPDSESRRPAPNLLQAKNTYVRYTRTIVTSKDKHANVIPRQKAVTGAQTTDKQT